MEYDNNTIPMLTRLFVIRMVASKRRGFSRRETIRREMDEFSSSKALSWLLSSEKKATSDPLINAEITRSRKRIRKLLTIPHWMIRKSKCDEPSGSKVYGLVQEN